MIDLSPATAIAIVRKNLDEIEPNGSVMYDDENEDNRSLSDIIRKNLPEAINAVNLAAPVVLLEGEEYGYDQFTQEEAESVSVSSDNVLSFSLAEDSAFLRLVAFQASDSPIVVTDVIGEASPEGRKQLNKYIRGTYDRPRLIVQQGRHTGPQFKYYSLKSQLDPDEAIARLSFVKEQFFTNSNACYQISRRLRQNILDYLTAMVLETYGDQRAQGWYTKAASFPII